MTENQLKMIEETIEKDQTFDKVREQIRKVRKNQPKVSLKEAQEQAEKFHNVRKQNTT